MSYTRKQFITEALAELGLASHVVDSSPEDLEAVGRRLDGMMATWNGDGIRLGYPLPANPDDSDLNAETGVPDWANEAIYLNLAIKIAPSYGKSVPIETHISAKQAKMQVVKRITTENIPQVQIPPITPMGAGNRRGYGYVSSGFATQESDPISANNDGEIILE